VALAFLKSSCEIPTIDGLNALSIEGINFELPKYQFSKRAPPAYCLFRLVIRGRFRVRASLIAFGAGTAMALAPLAVQADTPVRGATNAKTVPLNRVAETWAERINSASWALLPFRASEVT
jgi:hypothetical protein